jgi:DNA-binding FadR family transcriptional regulator
MRRSQLKVRPNLQLLFSPIKSRRTFEEVSTEIKKLIFDGVLKPGDRLPSETELARQFGVGRQTVREALRLLELSGFIAIQRGVMGGPLIVDTILNTLSNSLFDAIQIKKITIDQLTVARLEIERVVLNHVFKNGEDSDFRILQDNIVRAKKKINDGIQAFDENIQFHKLLARASGNPVFAIMLEPIMAVVADFLSRFKPNLEHSNNVIEAHEAILEAIRGRRIEEATQLLELHLLEIRNRLQIFDEEQNKTRRI